MLMFNATIEYLPGLRTAIVELTDAKGQWAGSGRVEVKCGGRGALYEAGYNAASQRAALKGGRLETFREES